MFSIGLNIVVLILLWISTYRGQCCGPAEIGQKFTITSKNFSSTGDTVLWQLDNGITVYESTSEIIRISANYSRVENSNLNLYPELFDGSRTSLTILNVSNTYERVYHHLVNGYTVYSCNLNVFKRASIPTCETMTLTGNQIRTKCTTAQVYPQAKCQFILQNGGTDRRDNTDGISNTTYTHTDPQPGGNEYYSTSCTLQYPVDGLKPGNWTVQVNMYPDLTGLSSAQGTIGQVDNTLQLSVPVVSIDTNNCPKGLAGEGDTNVIDGYIKQGERVSCLCRRAHAGNPPATIEWRSTQDGSFDTLSQSEDEVTIKINMPDTFTCQSSTVLDGSDSVTYTPKYAYGPSSASLIFQPSGPIYLCPNQKTNINIICQVPANSFNPALLFTIRDGDDINIVTKAAGDTERSKSVNYNFTKSGQYTFTCRAENAIFSDLSSEAAVSAIEVYEPPNRPPSLQVTGQFVITDDSGTWVKQRSDLSVSCLAGDAYPLVNSVTVTCGQETSPSGQLTVSGVTGDELTCQCTVDHETNNACNGRNLNEDMNIQTAYGPSEVTIRLADDQFRALPVDALNLCGSEDLEITVICAVKQSHIRPGLASGDFSLTKPKEFISQRMYLSKSEGEYRLVNNLKVTSSGSHSLVCEARNPVFSDIKQSNSTTFEVREPPIDPPKISAQSNQHGDILVKGDDVTVTCNVSGGFPAVQSVTLTCGQTQSLTSIGTLAVLALNRIGSLYDKANCTCQAAHVTGCYDLMGVLSLIVVSPNVSVSEENNNYIFNFTTGELVGVIVGSILATYMLVAGIALIVFCIRREQKRNKNRSTNTEYDKIDRPIPPHYQNVKPRDSSYQTMNPSEKAQKRENTIQETELTNRNEASGDYAEPVEFDLKVYSEIDTD